MFKRVLTLLLVLLMFLLVCPTFAWANDAQAKQALETWLSEVCSFRISLVCVNPAVNGYSHEIHQQSAADGSFHFVSTFKQWDHLSAFEYEETAEYFYRYENETLVCYMKIDGQQPSRGELSAAQEAELFASKQQMVGPNVILSLGMENFKRNENETDAYIYSFALSLEAIEGSGTLLEGLILNTAALTGKEPDQDLCVYADFEVEPETLRPVRLTYDFTELIPFLFSDGALSAEFALGVDLMQLTYEFDYDLEETISLPEDFLL